MYRMLFLISVCLYPFLPLHGQIDQNTQVVFITIPKCGTHLGTKCAKLLIQKKPNCGFRQKEATMIFPWQLPRTLATKKPNFFWVHSPCTRKAVNVLKKHQPITFFIYRDPRDHLLSLINWVKENPDRFPHLANLKRNQIFRYILTKPLGRYWAPTSCLKDYYRSFLLWRKLPFVLSLRFENLVGPQGGGSQQIQNHQVKKIAHHLGIKVNKKEIRECAEQLFGGTETFRKGKAGAWQDEFTNKQRLLFKKYANDILIQTGYETGYDW